MNKFYGAIVSVTHENGTTVILLENGARFVIYSNIDMKAGTRVDVDLSNIYSSTAGMTTNNEVRETPPYIWAVIAIGAILVIAVILLIIRTRRVP